MFFNGLLIVIVKFPEAATGGPLQKHLFYRIPPDGGAG